MARTHSERMRSYKAMPDELKGGVMGDPRKMYRGYLSSKISNFRYRLKQVEGEMKVLEAEMKAVAPTGIQKIIDQIAAKLACREERLMQMIPYLQCLEARKAGA